MISEFYTEAHLYQGSGRVMVFAYEENESKVGLKKSATVEV